MFTTTFHIQHFYLQRGSSSPVSWGTRSCAETFANRPRSAGSSRASVRSVREPLSQVKHHPPPPRCYYFSWNPPSSLNHLIWLILLLFWRVPQCAGAARGAGGGVPAGGRVQGAVRWDPVHRPASHRWDGELAQWHGCWVQLGGPGPEQQQLPWKHLQHLPGELEEREAHWAETLCRSFTLELIMYMMKTKN